MPKNELPLITSASSIVASGDTVNDDEACSIPTTSAGMVAPQIRHRSRPTPVDNIAGKLRTANRVEPKLAVTYVKLSELHRSATKLRVHSEKQIAALIGSIRAFGLSAPVIVDDANVIIDGDALYEAASRLNFDVVPVISLAHLSKAQLRLYRVAIHKLSEMSRWDEELLQIEMIDLLPSLLEFDIEPESLGFSTTEFDFLVEAPKTPANAEIEIEPAASAVTNTNGPLR